MIIKTKSKTQKYNIVGIINKFYFISLKAIVF